MLTRPADDTLIPDTTRAAKRSGEAPEPPATDAAAALWSELGNRCLYLNTVRGHASRLTACGGCGSNVWGKEGAGRGSNGADDVGRHRGKRSLGSTRTCWFLPPCSPSVTAAAMVQAHSPLPAPSSLPLSHAGLVDVRGVLHAPYQAGEHARPTAQQTQ